tara:strand:- start:77 stop:286 length:210 start_codon:yes stop_codon:yes gene_type:complete
MENIDTQAMWTAIQLGALLIGPIILTLGVLIYQHHKDTVEFYRIQAEIADQRHKDLNISYRQYREAWGK